MSLPQDPEAPCHREMQSHNLDKASSVDKSHVYLRFGCLQIVILVPHCCETEVLLEEEAGACHEYILQSCTALEDDHCFQRAAGNSICGSYSFGQPNHRLM